MMKLKFFSNFLFFCILINFNLVAADCKKPQMPSDAEWHNWLSEIKKEALDLGISKKTINNELKGILPQKKIIMRASIMVREKYHIDKMCDLNFKLYNSIIN